MSGIAGRVDFNLLTGFPGNVHGRASFLLILTDVFAELGIYEQLLT